MQKAFIPVIAGPTASGKTSLSIELAKRFNGEIVSADSMQIYKRMDIATAKPDATEMQGIPHHLIGIIEPGDEFSVAQYKVKAIEAIEDILSRGKQPIVVGGTGLYIDTLIKNTEFFDYEKSDIRSNLEARNEKEGTLSLLNELSSIDPATAEKLHINDTKRIIRALEVYYSTGKTISEQCELSHLTESPYRWCIIGLNADERQYLYNRINLRVDIMLENGLIDEAREFYASDVSHTAVQAIGYKELKPYLDGEKSLDSVIDKLKMETRRYAKRQLTWLRRYDEIKWLMIDRYNGTELVDQAAAFIEENRR